MRKAPWTLLCDLNARVRITTDPAVDWRTVIQDCIGVNDWRKHSAMTGNYLVETPWTKGAS